MSDYISREAAVKIAQKYGLVNGSALGRRSGLADCIAIEIEGLPATDVEPVRRGRWISWEDADNCIPSPNRHECSVCHDAAQVLVNNIELLSNYCPNCGAKMDLEDENNDD